jgi:hypothetical protein
MPSNVATLAVKIVSDASGAAKGFNDVGTNASKMGQRAQAGAKVAAVGLAAVGVAAFKQASAMQQADGAVQAVFKSQSGAVRKLAEDAANNLGLARSEYSQMAAVFGSQLKNMGVSSDQLVPKTSNLIKLGGDLAAQYGGPTSQAVQALSSLLRGERDPIEQYGVSIKQADIAAQMAADGTNKLTGSSKKAAETQATLKLLYQQSADAVGAYGRENGSAAQQQAEAMAKLKNAGADIGTTLLPVVAGIATGLGKVAGVVQSNATAFKVLAGVAGALALATFAVNGAISAYTAVVAIARGAVIVFRNAQLALNLAMMANPIGLIILAVVALVAAIVIAYKKSETFRTIVQAVGKACAAAFQWVVDKAKDVWTWIQKLGPVASAAKDVAVKAFNAYTAPIRFVIGLVKDLINWIKKIDFPSPPGWLGSLLGGPPELGGAPGGSRSAYSSLTGRGGPGGGGGFVSMVGGGRRAPSVTYVFNISGVVGDEDSLARKIEQMLRQRGGRLGATL